jgi:hypothetical protein
MFCFRRRFGRRHRASLDDRATVALDETTESSISGAGGVRGEQLVERDSALTRHRPIPRVPAVS